MDGPEHLRELNGVIEDHVPLVRHIVFQVAANFPRHVDREELVRAGMLGLVEAAHRFDASRGVPFQRYAAQRIRGAILDMARSADWAPRSVRQGARQVEAAQQRLSAALGRPPTTDEVASELGLTAAQLTVLLDRVHRSAVLALNHIVPSEAEDDVTLLDVLTDDGAEPDEQLERRELHGFLRDGLKHLPDRHRTVVVGYFLEGWTSQELAEHLGVTTSRVSQLRTEALEMLKDGITQQYASSPGALPLASRSSRRRAEYAASIAMSSRWQDRLEHVNLVDAGVDRHTQFA